MAHSAIAPHSAYDQFADTYYAMHQQGTLIHDLVVPPLIELLGPISGRRVCDLACGEGFVARVLAKAGARVIGIDSSEKMLQMARYHEACEPLGIIYLLDDAQKLGTLKPHSFDAVVSNMALTDISDLAATATTVARILKPGGRFLFSIPHPCFQTPDSDWIQDPSTDAVFAVVRKYFNEGHWQHADPTRWSGMVGSYHRMLSTYLNLLSAVGLVFEVAHEPQASDALRQRKAGYSEVAGAFIACFKRPEKHSLAIQLAHVFRWACGLIRNIAGAQRKEG